MRHRMQIQGHSNSVKLIFGKQLFQNMQRNYDFRPKEEKSNLLFSCFHILFWLCCKDLDIEKKCRRTVAKIWSPPSIFITLLHGKLPLSILPCNKIHTWKSRKKNKAKMSGFLFGIFRMYQLEAENESSSGNRHCWTDGVYIPQEGRNSQ